MTQEKAAKPRLRRRLRDLFGDRSVGASEPSRLHTDLNARLTVVETALEHLEAALEGLQDATHRRSRLSPLQSTLHDINVLVTRILWRTQVCGRFPFARGQGAVIAAAKIAGRLP